MGTTRRVLDVVIDVSKQGYGTQTLTREVDDLGLQSQLTTRKLDQYNKKLRDMAKAVDQGSISYNEAEKELREYRRELGLTSSTSERAQRGMRGMTTSVLAGVGAYISLQTAIAATRFAAEQFVAGARLSTIEKQYNALSQSIGTTSTALLQDMRAATDGMVSDSKLMQGASELISYGLAKNHSDVVTLSNLVGRLNLDMQVLGLTLANNSEMRLDALGLSVEGVKKKIEELREAGTQGDLFDIAVIKSLEERLAVLEGGTSEAEGAAKRLETQWINVKEAVQQDWAEFIAPLLLPTLDATSLRRQIKEQFDLTYAEIGKLEDAAAIELAGGFWADAFQLNTAERQIAALTKVLQDLQAEADRTANSYQNLSVTTAEGTQRLLELKSATSLTTEEIHNMRKAVGFLRTAQRGDQTLQMAKDQDELTSKLREAGVATLDLVVAQWQLIYAQQGAKYANAFAKQVLSDHIAEMNRFRKSVDETTGSLGSYSGAVRETQNLQFGAPLSGVSGALRKALEEGASTEEAIEGVNEAIQDDQLTEFLRRVQEGISTGAITVEEGVNAAYAFQSALDNGTIPSLLNTISGVDELAIALGKLPDEKTITIKLEQDSSALDQWLQEQLANGMSDAETENQL